MLEVRCLDPVASAAPSFGDTMVTAKGSRADGLRGTFEDMPLAEILSGVEFNQKTGVIDIQGDEGLAGFVSYRGGAPHQARCGKQEGEPAVLALLRIFRKGRFILRSDEARSRAARDRRHLHEDPPRARTFPPTTRAAVRTAE